MHPPQLEDNDKIEFIIFKLHLTLIFVLKRIVAHLLFNLQVNGS